MQRAERPDFLHLIQQQVDAEVIRVDPTVGCLPPKFNGVLLVESHMEPLCRVLCPLAYIISEHDQLPRLLANLVDPNYVPWVEGFCLALAPAESSRQQLLYDTLARFTGLRIELLEGEPELNLVYPELLLAFREDKLSTEFVAAAKRDPEWSSVQRLYIKGNDARTAEAAAVGVIAAIAKYRIACAQIIADLVVNGHVDFVGDDVLCERLKVSLRRIELALPFRIQPMPFGCRIELCDGYEASSAQSGVRVAHASEIPTSHEHAMTMPTLALPTPRDLTLTPFAIDRSQDLGQDFSADNGFVAPHNPAWSVDEPFDGESLRQTREWAIFPVEAPAAPAQNLTSHTFSNHAFASPDTFSRHAFSKQADQADTAVSHPAKVRTAVPFQAVFAMAQELRRVKLLHDSHPNEPQLVVGRMSHAELVAAKIAERVAQSERQSHSSLATKARYDALRGGIRAKEDALAQASKSREIAAYAANNAQTTSRGGPTREVAVASRATKARYDGLRRGMRSIEKALSRGDKTDAFSAGSQPLHVMDDGGLEIARNAGQNDDSQNNGRQNDDLQNIAQNNLSPMSTRVSVLHIASAITVALTTTVLCALLWRLINP